VPGIAEGVYAASLSTGAEARWLRLLDASHPSVWPPFAIALGPDTADLFAGDGQRITLELATPPTCYGAQVPATGCLTDYAVDATGALAWTGQTSGRDGFLTFAGNAQGWTHAFDDPRAPSVDGVIPWGLAARRFLAVAGFIVGCRPGPPKHRALRVALLRHPAARPSAPGLPKPENSHAAQCDAHPGLSPFAPSSPRPRSPHRGRGLARRRRYWDLGQAILDRQAAEGWGDHLERHGFMVVELKAKQFQLEPVIVRTRRESLRKRSPS
jgi:hypothetical protein